MLAKSDLYILLLQESHIRGQDAGHIFVGLGKAIRVAAVSQRLWAAVAVCNPKLQILIVSQLSTSHCVCAEVQAPGFSFHVSCYFQYSDEIERHLGHLDTDFVR